MTEPNPTPGDYLNRAKDEITAMAKDGIAHPSSKPVLTGIALGAVAGFILPVITMPIGIVGGAGFALWRRISR